MPKFSVAEKILLQAIDRNDMSMKEFDELCFEFGIELDEWEDVEEGGCVVGRYYKIEIPANRYDLLCFEGLTRALNVFLGNKEHAHIYRVLSEGVVCQKLRILPETADVRPFCLAAVLRGVTLNKTRYDSLIDLQEKLHHNICRERTLASIGIHNLDSIEGPFTYEALPPEEIKFIPLNQTKEFTAKDLMQLYKSDPHLKPYLHIIEKKPRYPVIYDKNRVLLSLPPIINGNHTRLDENSRNLFIDVTATDLNKAHIVLNTVVTMFSEYCDNQFTAEPCEIESPDGSKKVYPDLSYRTESVSLAYLNQGLGLKSDADTVSKLLTRMCLTSLPDPSGDNIVISVPPTRADVIHPCDIMEDYAIAYGYNKIPRSLPDMSTTGKQQPLNKLTDLLRLELAQAGFTELLTFTMCGRKDICERLNLQLQINEIPAVHVANPKAAEFQVVRTSLIPGILKTLSSNLNLAKPLKVFEISDIVLKTPNKDVQAENTRNLCAAYFSTTAGFEIIHGLLERVMLLVDVVRDRYTGYELEAVDEPSYFPGRCVQVLFKGPLPKNLSDLEEKVQFVLCPNCVKHKSSQLELSVGKIRFTIEYRMVKACISKIPHANVGDTVLIPLLNRM